ncbi:transposase [Clostridium celatum]|uniref:transposase n=1 Tax=Clostridium celatum TaxID=36834 RepID=UPI001897CFA2|nr:transposase [Clostridium celatum]
MKNNTDNNSLYMLFKVPHKMGVSRFVGYLKRKSNLMIFEIFSNLKHKYGNRYF